MHRKLHCLFETFKYSFLSASGVLPVVLLFVFSSAFSQTKVSSQHIIPVGIAGKLPEIKEHTATKPVKTNNTTSWVNKVDPGKNNAFIENHGQYTKLLDSVADENEVLYCIDDEAMRVYFTKHGLVYQLSKKEQVSDEEYEKYLKENRLSKQEKGDEDKEDGGPKSIIVKHYIKMNWDGYNPSVNVTPEERTSFYFNYYRPDINRDKIIGRVPGYKKLLYTNIYPNIDIEYMIDSQDGIKYSYILHPGADVSKIKMNYSGGILEKDGSGNVIVSTAGGGIKDLAPNSYYGNINTVGEQITSSFKISEGSTVGFSMSGESSIVNQTVVIDPITTAWTINPVIVNAGTPNSTVCFIAVDGSNNSIIDGMDETTNYQYIEKYNSAGTLQWTLQTYGTGTVVHNMGAVAADPSGNIYTTDGLVLNSYTQYYNTCSFDPTGTILRWGSAGPTASSNNLYETWNITYNCDKSVLLQSGGGEIVGGTADFNFAGFEPVDPATGTEGTVTYNTGIGEVISSRFASNGYLYLLTSDSNMNDVMAGHNATTGPNNKFVCVNPSAGYATVFVVNTGYDFQDGDIKAGISTHNGSVGYNGIGSSCNYVYTTDGVSLDQRNLNTGALIKRVTITGGSNSRTAYNINSGIVTDMCGNVYIGSSKTIYEYDENLNYIGTAATGLPDMVFDMKLGNNGTTIYACGGRDATSFITAINIGTCSTGVTSSTTAASCTTGGTATANPTFCASPYTYLWSDGQTTQTAIGLTGGTYTVTVTGAIDCEYTYSATTTATITPPTPPPAPTLGANTPCSGQTLTLSASSAGATSYSWVGPNSFTSSSATPSIVGVTTAAAGVYTVTASSGPLCTSPTATINVTVNATPTISTSAPPTICASSPTTLTASGALTYSWSTTATTSSITVSPSTTATYSVNGTGAGGCPAAQKTIVVTVTTPPTVTISALPSGAVCSGTPVTLTANGGTGGTTYLWSTGATTSSISVTPATTTGYSVTASNGVCSGGAVPTTITVNPTPTVTASALPSSTICAGSSVKLTATPSGLASYTWTSAATLTTTTYDTTTATPTVTTTYTVVGTTAAGCSNTTPATTAITVNSSPTVSVSALPASICSGSSTVLTATGAGLGGSYTWNTGVTASSITVSPLTTTTYTVTGTNAAGCSNSNSVKTITVTVTTTPTVTVSPTSPIGLCPGDTAKITASGATTYSWNTGQTTDTIMAHPATSTTYTVTGINGVCTGKTVVTVNVGAINVTATASSLLICRGQPDTIKAGGATTYVWNTGNTNSSFVITATKDTSFSVKGTSGSGCNGTATVSIKVNSVASITASAPSPGTVCPGDTTKAYVTLGSAGTPPYTFNWSTTPVQTNDTARGLGAGTYTVSVTDANHCTSDTVSVTITTKNISVSASAAPSSTICAGNSTTLTATGATNYIWSTGATTSTITVNPGVDSTFKVIGTTTGTCKDSDTVAIKVNPLPNVTVKPSDSAICSGQSTVLTASGASTYSWLPSTTPSTGSPVTATPTTNTTYSVIGKSAAGCIDTATVYITVNATPTASVKITGGNDTICPGKFVILTASGGSTYVWSPGGLTSAAVNVKPTTNPTTYTVTAISANGVCKDVATQSIYIFPTLSVNIKGLDSICNGQFDTLRAIPVGGNPLPGYTYKWNPPIGTGPGPYVVKPGSAITYSCTITDGCGDTASTIIKVSIRPSPIANFTATPNPVGAGEFVAFIDSSTNASAWYWTFGDGNTSTSSFPYNQYLAAGNYVATLWVTSNAGCRDSLRDTIHVIEIIYVPNVFTPNGDGQNDVFHVTANGVKVYTIHIFNRWGQEVFNAADPNIDWDGRSPAGVQESDGIYYYIIKATDYSNKSYDFNGYLQLIR